MNFGEMRTEVFRRLEENSSSPVVFSTADVNSALNEGYEEISEATEWYESSVTINLIGYRTYYNLHAEVTSETFLAPTRAWNTQTSRWLEPVDVRTLDFATYRRWETNTGEPDQMFMRGGSHLGVYPKTAADSGTIVAYYTAIPARLSADADTPAFPQEYHETLVEYAIYDLFSQLAETVKALDFWQAYKAGEQSLKRYVDKRVSRDRTPSFRRQTGSPKTRVT